MPLKLTPGYAPHFHALWCPRHKFSTAHQGVVLEQLPSFLTRPLYKVYVLVALGWMPCRHRLW